MIYWYIELCGSKINDFAVICRFILKPDSTKNHFYKRNVKHGKDTEE